MKIAIYQINTTVGNFKGNESKILKGIDLAKRKEASLAIFPEMATFGYPPRDLLDKPYLVDANIAVANRIAKQTTKDFGCIFGFIARNENKIGRGLFNAAALAFDGKIQNVQPKTLLPTYDVFDELRYFVSGNKRKVVEINGKKVPRFKFLSEK